MKRILTLVMCALIALPSISQKFNEHPWKKKRVAYFGDSITDPRLKASKTKYWGFLEEWLGITPYVYGVSGRQWNDIPRQADKLKAEHGDDFDAILIFIGTNDFNAAVPIGEWYNVSADSVVAAHKGQWEKAKYLRYHRTMNMNNSTLKGRINIALDKLKKMYPKKQIVLMTPIHRADFKSSDTNIQPAEDYANACGFFIDDYVQAIKEAGNVWSVPVIDLNALSGLYPLTNEGAQLFNKPDTDRLHPNDAGHYRMAKTILYQLSTLPCTFDM